MVNLRKQMELDRKMILEKQEKLEILAKKDKARFEKETDKIKKLAEKDRERLKKKNS